jgi:hypothetical protein
VEAAAWLHHHCGRQTNLLRQSNLLCSCFSFSFCSLNNTLNGRRNPVQGFSFSTRSDLSLSLAGAAGFLNSQRSFPCWLALRAFSTRSDLSLSLAGWRCGLSQPAVIFPFPLLALRAFSTRSDLSLSLAGAAGFLNPQRRSP